MANITITQLPTAQTLTGAESVPVVQNGVTVQTTTGAIANSPVLTQTFITATAQPALGNSRYLTAGPGLAVVDSGAGGSFSTNLVGAPLALVTSPSGFQVKTATNTLAGRTFQTGNGLAVTNPDGVTGNPVFTLTGIAAAIAGSSGTGMLAIVGGTAIANRSIVGVTNQISVTDGNGAGNPTIGLANNPITPGTGSITVPVGTVAQRSGGLGALRYDTDLNAFEGYTSTGWGTIVAGGSAGTVTSVGVSAPSFLTVANSPITTAGTIALSYSGTALPSANGGTGLTSPGVSGNVLTSTGTGWKSSPASGGGGAGFEVGEVILATDTPATGTWLETGKYYSKAAYPALAAKIGDVADFGTPVAVSQAQLPQVFSVSAPNSTAAYITATNGTITVSVGGAGAIRTTTDGINWQGVPSTATAAFYEVRYLNGIFIAVGASGTIVTSTDGTNWVFRANPNNNNNYSVAFGNGNYVISTALGLVYSSDLINWVVSPTNTGIFNRVIFANSLFIAVGNGGLCYSSPDGITWTSRSAGANGFYDVIFANNIFVAVGANGNCYSSPDGITWTSRSAGSTRLNNIIFANGLFVTVGDNSTIYTSPDGITWTVRVAAATFEALYFTCWNGSNYISVGAAGIYYTSPDGITWTKNFDVSCSTFWNVSVINGKTIAFGGNSSVVLAGAARQEVLQSGAWGYTLTASSATNPRSIAHNGSNLYVAAGANNTILTSPDGQTWTRQSSGYTGVSSLNFDKVFYLNNTWFVLGANVPAAGVVTSTDGITWTPRTTSAAVLNAAAYGASVYVAVGSNGACFSSPDRVTWTSHPAGANVFSDVIFANGVFVAVGSNGACYSSSDGTLWVIRTAGAASFQRIIYANSLFVAVAATGVIYTSPDGTTWTVRTSNVTGQLTDITWNGSIFCAVGTSGVITTSSDGLTWAARTPGDLSVSLLSISWNGTRFVVTNTSNAGVWTSTDGITWLRASTVYQGTTLYSCYLGGKFLAVGSGFIQTSTNGFNWTNCDHVQYVPTGVSKLYKFGSNYYALTTKGLFQSTDGISFSLAGQTLPSSGLLSMAYSGTTLVMLASAISGQPQTFYKSTDGITWAKSAELGVLTTTSTIAGSAADLVYANGNFICGQPTAVVQQLPYTIYTSTDGITWTGRQTPYLAAPSSAMASDGTTAVFMGASGGTFKSIDGGVSWAVLTTVSNVPIVYLNNAWVFAGLNNFTVSTDLQNFVSTGITASAQQAAQFYSSGNSILGVQANNKVLFNKKSSGYVAIPITGSVNIVYTITYKEIPVRGTTALTLVTQNQNIAPNLILEIPLYSYDTATTFWSPPSNAGVGQIAYIYAGA